MISKQEWLDKCLKWKKNWQVCLPEYRINDKDGINIYYFLDVLSELSREGEIFITDAGSSFYTVFQSLKIKKNQRIICPGQAEMFFSIPGAIGACFENNKKDIVVITGDGSFGGQSYEVETIVYHKLPIKIFIINNSGFLSIRATQDNLFEKRRLGTDNNSGISFPNIEKIAFAYNIKYTKIRKIIDLKPIIKEVLEINEPIICEIICPENQPIIPTIGAFKD
ncbi:MAG: thiamine pyrophosphate-dependent enzyme, partial [Nanoarchaeota archaeon]